MSIIPQHPLSPHGLEGLSAYVLVDFILVTQTNLNFLGRLNYQLSAIKMKSNHSLARRIAAGSADAGDITVAYRTLSLPL